MRWAIGLLVCSIFTVPVSAATVVIDDFTAGAMAIVDNALGGPNISNPPAVPSTLTQPGLPTANVLGGHRVSTINAVSGSLANLLDATFTIDLPAPVPVPSADIAGNAVLANTPISGETHLTLSYLNGVAHDLTIDAFGKIGTPDTSFVFFDFVSSLSLEINASAQDTDGDIATTTLTTPPGGGPSIDETVVFSSWSNAANVNFESIQNLTFQFVARNGSSFALNSVNLGTTIPEPSSIALLGSLCIAVGCYRRRTKNKIVA